MSKPDIEATSGSRAKGLQGRIDELTAELAKTQLALWDEVDRRRKAEQAFHELEEMHYHVLEAANCGILISDREGKILNTNSSLQKISGYTAEELQVKGFTTLLPNSAHRRELYRMLSAFEGTRDWQVPFKRKDDTICTALLNINPTELKGQKVLVARIQDISYKEHSRKSVNYQNQIINHISDPIFVINREHILVHANDAFCSFLGRKRETILGTTGYEQMHGERASRLFKQDEEIFKTGRECITEDTFTDGNGDNRSLVTKKVLLVRKNGEKQIIGIIRDITEQKSLEAQYLQAQKMEAIGVLAGSVAHDFNNLLNVINGYSELALENPSIDSTLRKDIENILEAAKRASSITSQLLAFSRKQILQAEILNLNDVISGMKSMLRRLIGEDIECTANLQQDIGLINADIGQINQIVMNLAVNSRDAMPNGGKLIIETADFDFDGDCCRDHPEVKPGRYVMLSVRDTGIGMDEKTKNRLFEPFFTTKDKERGTGLGLSTVYGIVRQSDGFIRVYSEQGKGTTFKIYFPSLDREVIKSTGADNAETQLQ